MGSLERKIPGRDKVRIFEDVKSCLAVDLGQSVDPTGIAAVQHIRKMEVSINGKERQIGEAFHVPYLARLPLGLSYIVQVQEVAKLLQRPPLDQGCDLVVDATGVGRAVVDLFERVGLYPTRVTITSGEKATCTGPRSWHVPKGVLISALDARLHSKELKIAAELTEAGVLAEEMKDFRRTVSAASRYTWSARVGKHDDILLAVSLGLWNFVGKPKPPPVAQVSRASFT